MASTGTSAPAGASYAASWASTSRCCPPQQRIDEHWYKGTADAIYQNIYTIEKHDAAATS